MTHMTAAEPLDPMPIDPASIVAGDPQASGTVLYTTPDGRTIIGLFRCTPGTFRFTLEAEEFTHLLSGRVVIQPDGGDRIEATTGDTYVLPAGASMLIDVEETIVDVYASWAPGEEDAE